MARITKSGVCYDLKSSPYKVWYGGFTFYFSSITHKVKFQENARMKVEWLNHSLSKRFHFEIEAGIIALFQLYLQCETRGFYVVRDDNMVYLSTNDITIRTVL